MSLENTFITSNGDTLLITTLYGNQGIAIFYRAGAAFDGGVLSLGIRKVGSTDPLMYIIPTVEGFPSSELPVKGDCEVWATMTGGGASINIELLVTRG